MKNKTYNRRKIFVVFMAAVVMISGLLIRLGYLMIIDAGYYQKKAEALHEREREIKAARGEIIDRNGTVLAMNRTVCTISVIHSQITNAEKVISSLTDILEMDETTVRKKVEKISSMEQDRLSSKLKELTYRKRMKKKPGLKNRIFQTLPRTLIQDKESCIPVRNTAFSFSILFFFRQQLICSHSAFCQAHG